MVSVVILVVVDVADLLVDLVEDRVMDDCGAPAMIHLHAVVKSGG